MNRSREPRALLLLAMLAWACTVAERETVQPRPAPQVEVFTPARGPTRPYRVLREIAVREGVPDESVVETLRTEAGKSSCDGIILSEGQRRATCIVYTPGVGEPQLPPPAPVKTIPPPHEVIEPRK